MAFAYNIKKLQDMPGVRSVTRDKLILDSDLRIQLYRIWKENGQESSAVAKALDEKGLTMELIGPDYPGWLANRFYMAGFPVFSREERDHVPDYREQNPLIRSGKFYLCEAQNGVSVTNEFLQTIMESFPETSVIESIQMAGLDPVDVGYSRIRKIERDIRKKMSGRKKNPEMEQNPDPLPVSSTYVEMASETLKGHPYVSRADKAGIILTDSFYNEAYLLYPLGLESILAIFELDTDLFTGYTRTSVISRLHGWEPVPSVSVLITVQTLRISQAREAAMNRLVGEQFRELGSRMPSLGGGRKRAICQWIRGLPRDPWGYYTKEKILSLMGMKKSTYYGILGNEDYGTAARRRAAQEEKDLALIQEVLAYKGFEKGIRQVYMLMPRITGQQLSLYRIRKIMNKYGIRTTIRHPSKNRKAMKELIARNKKANLLMRRFRMHRPNEVRLTDVTYLDYGDGKRAYGSASIDPVTGRLVCFIVSENNDLKLALDTLEAMDTYPAKNEAILHSDQGMLYMTDDFQAAVVERGLNQSMSRRGNCWDNAPQESFHGHFKDECHYEKCQTIEELRELIGEYSVYYNNERGMWDRGMMTPVEYEAYLNAMSDEEFRDYLAREEEKYQEMKEKAAERAVQESREYRDAAIKGGKCHEDQTGKQREV